MSIDPYAPCPCGSGKKLKFCCSDLVGEIEKVEKLISGEQPHAALRHVERLLEKQPERASLLDLRSSLELSLDELDKAQATIQDYLRLHPENPSAYAQAAFLAAGKGETAAAVGALQAAMERIDGEALPVRLYQALGSVGHALLLRGDMVAARAHLTLYASVAPEGDTQGFDLLMRLNAEGRPPLLLRDQFPLAEPPADASWRAGCEEANQNCRRGLWQRAEAEYVQLLENVPAESAPQLVYNLALVRGWLGDTPRFAAGLREYARLDVPREDAVEAFALAELVARSEQEPLIPTLQKRFAIQDADDVFEKLLADRRAVQVAIKQQAADDDDGPPRGAFWILDKPAIVASDDLKLEDIPNVWALVSVYGKRTDRDAQLTLTAEEGAEYDGAVRMLRELLADGLGEELQTEVIQEIPRSTAVLQWKWRLPDGIDPSLRESLHQERRRQIVLEKWGETPQGILGGRTPNELVGDESQQIALAAALLVLEQSAQDEEEDNCFTQLRAQLQLPPRETIDPAQVDPMRVPLVRVARLDFRAIPSDVVEPLLARLLVAAAELAISRLAAEMVRRVEEQQDAQIDASLAYRELISSQQNPRRALEVAARAKEWAASHGQSTAPWALNELELQLELADPNGIRDAVEYLQQHHGKDPEVGEQIYRLLYAAGLGPLLERGHQPAPPAAPEQSAEAPAIWTPDAPPASPSGKGSSAIWTP